MKRILASGLLLLACASSAQAGLIFYINDQAGFEAAVAPSSFDFRGIEDFENNTLADGSSALINDPLEPGITSSPAFFPTGTNPATGLTYQSNTGGGNHSNESPRVSSGLVLTSAGFLSNLTDQVFNNFQADSIDMIFSLADPVLAVSFLPLYLNSSFDPTQIGTLSIDVYDSSNVLLNTSPISISGVNFLATSFVGVVATGTDNIGRINLWDGNASLHWQGADDIAVYASPPPPPGTAPEPTTLALLSLGLAGLGFARKRTR